MPGNMQENGLQRLYMEQLKDIYSAESQLLKALPKMAKAARSQDLRQGFEKHLEQTKGQVERLEQIFRALDENPKGKKCMGMQGLIEEGEEVIKEESATDALDAGLIAAAQRVEHYEIAAYGSVRAFAELLGDDDSVNLLRQTLEEEKETDKTLTELSAEINTLAMNAGRRSGQDTEESAGRGRRAAKARSARA
jgi:ferritin-like metal-binding protein YciE